MTYFSARLRLEGSSGASGTFTHTPRFDGGPAAMTSLIGLVRRAAVAGAIACVSVAPALAAQTSQMSVVDEHRYLSPGMQGFERRREAGFGHFITDSMLRAAEGARLANLLEQHIPSLILGSNPVAGEFPISSRICAGGLSCSTPRCYVRVYLDGTLMFDGTPGMRDMAGVDVSHLRTQDYSGIEYYSGAGGLPAQYTGPNADCGTLMFWSRES